jgi:UDPglucose 6-dehydrogenase
MKIVVFGAGPVGLTTSLSLCIWGHDVLCVDTNVELIKSLSDGITELYEADISTELKSALIRKKIQFSTNPKAACAFSNIYFIAVGTPNLVDGSCDLSRFDNCVRLIAESAFFSDKTIVIKSTVPPLTNLNYSEKYKHTKTTFISNPEFLREGTALKDALHPDRILIGSLCVKSTELLQNIYDPVAKITETFVTDPTTAEISKYAANVFLAARISLINEFAKISDVYNADITTISDVIGSDPRIGSDFLKSGVGYGGSCLPKDVAATVSFSTLKNIELNLIPAIQKTNETQVTDFVLLIQKHSPQKKIALWGISFKPETNDLREAPALKIINLLLDDGFTIHVHDPQLSKVFLLIYSKQIQNHQILIFNDKIQALTDCSALTICTEWAEYSNADISEIKNNLHTPIIFDGRHIFLPSTMKENGIQYFSIGQKK